MEEGSAFPRKWPTILSEISLAIQALVEGVEETAIEDLIETFE